MDAVAHDRIVSDPKIMCGKPTIKSTRITVEPILEELGDGMSMAKVLAAHPHLREEDVRAASRCADENEAQPSACLSGV